MNLATNFPERNAVTPSAVNKRRSYYLVAKPLSRNPSTSEEVGGMITTNVHD
jgi:hypothetical protein